MKCITELIILQSIWYCTLVLNLVLNSTPSLNCLNCKNDKDKA